MFFFQLQNQNNNNYSINKLKLIFKHNIENVKSSLWLAGSAY